MVHLNSLAVLSDSGGQIAWKQGRMRPSQTASKLEIRN